MRLLPKSLFGRLVLVLVGGLLLAQLASAYINFAERDQLLYRAGGMRLAQQIADIVKLLEPLPDAERRKIVSVFNAPPLFVSLDRPPIAPEAEPAGGDFQLSMFSAVLRFALGEDARVALTRVDPGAPAPRFAPGPGPGMGGMMRGPGGGPGGHMRGLAPDLPAFTVQVRLRDGALATFDSSVEPPAAASPLRLVLALALLLVAVVVLSLIAVRWVTGPLSTLAGAAEALGQDLNRAPLPETGPLEVRRAATAFNGMQQRLSRMMSERTRTLAAISHDLKTPITRMRLRTELLEDPALRDKFEHDLGEMEQMVTQALEFMRDASEREPVHRIDVMALLESLQADFHDAHKEVEIEGRVANPVPARPLALRRCLSNLVENALRYGGSARIHAEEDAAGISLRVIDRGPGIPAEDLEKVFEPFYRGEASRSRETGGYGLGLAIARNIARAHGGDLTLANRAEGGLEAVLRLPKS